MSEEPDLIIKYNLDSKTMIGHARWRFDSLTDHPYRKNWDWVSFYNGWLEGRFDLIRVLEERMKRE